MVQLKVGKLPLNLLSEMLELMKGADDEAVIVGPRIGEDAAIIRVGPSIMAVHVDPITEASVGSARLSMIVASNDIAVTGVKPRWALITMLLPENINWNEIRSIADKIGAEAKKLGISVVGGHTEVSPGINKPIIVTTVIGESSAGKFIPTSGAMPGDYVIQVKPAALEGTYILATDFREKLLELGVKRDIIVRASQFINYLSVIDPALRLAGLEGIHSMHDPTEGGLIGGLLEMALSSDTTLRVEMKRFIIRSETLEISRALNIDWARLISSGTVIATIAPDSLNMLDEILEDYDYAVIGKVEAQGECPLIIEDTGECIANVPQDEISRFWSSTN
ncbi:MAG: AIR synthase family protein [Desulfurococcales archaeon]|nr:AIR synthase family protein [Desulfurococcales archaeon]